MTFDDLREWAGEAILNRGKGYVKRVAHLSRTDDNDLVAWVTGGKQYATWNHIDEEGNFEYFCTCPYAWGPCKHAVAVILAAADQVKKKVPIPMLDEDDELAMAIFGDTDEEDDEWEDDDPVLSHTPRRTKAQAEVGKISGDKNRARHWCMHGYAPTVDDAPGIATALQERLRTMTQKERRYDLVAAYRVQDFFARPSSTSYSELRNAADKAECWPTVQTAALRYLETGQRPTPDGRKRKSTGWPLPTPEVEPPATKKRSSYQRFPDLETLIDIAITEKRFDDVVDLYQRLRKTKRWASETDKTVAQAVANTHPDLALSIWQDIVNSLIDQVKPKAYEEAAVCLRFMKKIYTRNHRPDDWRGLLEGLRRKRKAKRRLMGVLDTLSEKKLVD